MDLVPQRHAPGLADAPSHPVSARARLHGWALALACLPLLAGCPMSSTPDAAQSAFATRIASLLKGRDSATVAAAELTDFAWSTLCFERDDTLLLKFDGQSPVVFKLRYEDYYVDEAHVARSLDGQCITPTDRIVVRRKYPGHPAPIEFQQAD